MTTQVHVPDPRVRPEGSRWLPWRVRPDSGFEVCVPPDPQRPLGEAGAALADGAVGLVQIGVSTFLVAQPFRFTDPAVQQSLRDRLRKAGLSAAEAERCVEDARTFTPSSENPTDLASIPRFVRWFEDPYGAHTLAAILHDELIRAKVNEGALRSDTLADRFFRQMLQASGVPWLKRWLMWAAVALRTRWAAGGARRASVVLWLVLAAVGIAAFTAAVGALLFSWDTPVDASVLLVAAVVLPVLSAPLWGRQAGAGLITAVGAAWILPAAVLAASAYVVYRGLERLAGSVGLR